MTTSTPPAWNWLHECYVPAETPELSIDSHKLPESDALRERNGSDTCHICLGRVSGTVFMHDGKAYCGGCAQLYDPDSKANDAPDPTYEDCWPSERYSSDGPERAVSTTASGTCCTDQCSDCRCAPGQPHAPGCSGVRSVRETPNKLRVGAPDEPPSWVCADCGQDRYGKPNGVSTWNTGYCDICGLETAVTEPRDFGNRHDAESTCTVTAPKTTSPADSFRVPFRVQEWIFESLAEVELDKLHDLIDEHHDRIIEMARDRFRKGYARYGSAMYSWTPERRLDETLQELADAVVYPTSGPIE